MSNLEINQADGPHRPLPKILAAMLDSVPSHCEVRSVAINGQTGKITIELLHEGLEMTYDFPLTPTIKDL